MDLSLPSKRFRIKELTSKDASEVLRVDVQEGLFSCPRSLPPKYFYDDKGSKLFDAICKTHDYYPTRTESALLQKNVVQIIDIVKPNTCAELGAGTSAKTEILLSKACSNLDNFTYLSIDVCQEVLIESANRLLQKYENLRVESVSGEYIPAIQNVPKLVSPTLYVFIGSSIGNFTELGSIELLSEVANKMSTEDYILIGMDRVKDKEILSRAYNDSDGVTSKFNLNVLNVLNYKLGSNFDLANFSHHAFYNEQQQQIEMYLISKCNQEVSFPTFNEKIMLKENEKILTEVSRKYTKASIKNILEKSGLQEAVHFEPSNQYFSLVLAKIQ